MVNVRVAYEILGPNKSEPIGWKASRDHLVYNVKMEFNRKY